jgi:hypothetical protein
MGRTEIQTLRLKLSADPFPKLEAGTAYGNFKEGSEKRLRPAISSVTLKGKRKRERLTATSGPFVER